jgi:cell division transport system permease protein
MKFSLPNRNLKRLGVALEKREYDLPFNDDRANRFLILLICLMTYLALLSASAGMVLSNMADRWTSGLADKITIELPTMDPSGLKLPPDQQQARLNTIETLLKGEKDIIDVKIQPPEDVAKLVEPWIGSSQGVLDQVPLPALISVTTTQDADLSLIPRVHQAIVTAVPDARVETHQNWLNDLLRLTGTLSFTAYLIGFITAITTISAVAGAVRARMAAHHEQLEILHLIGAADEYITRQFQKHALQLSFIGSGIGFVAAMLTLALIDSLAGTMDMALLPSLVLSPYAIIILLAIPMLSCLITVFTTRITVLQSLAEMP